MLAGGDEADAFAAKLAELGGKPESYDVTQEGVETAATAAAQADATSTTAEAAPTESTQDESSQPAA